jgi:hypothetical protein
MRTIRTIVLSAALLTTTTIATLVSGSGVAFAQPVQPLVEVVRGDGGGYALPSSRGDGYALPTRGDGGGYTIPTRGDGGGYTVPTRGDGGGYTISTRGDGGGYDLSSRQADEFDQDDGGGYATPGAPIDQHDSERWV